MSAYQSPISPGRSWYEDSCGDRPAYPALDGDISCDVAIIGGGYCGLSAALTLAESGTDVVLLEQHRLGDGASGRNGGQMGTGQRASVLDLEKQYGRTRARALWDIAEDAKKALLARAARYNFEIDHMPGQLTPMHKQRYGSESREEVEHLQAHYGYEQIAWLDRPTMAEALGSTHYFGGLRDTGTGHIHPMKMLIGLGKAAAGQGARVFENTAMTGLERGGPFLVRTKKGSVRASRVVLALNGYHSDIHPFLASRVMPIQSFIGATVPLGDDSSVIPGGEAVDDSRFVVRYFRKSRDGRLLFGGREAYGKAEPSDIERQIRRQITQIYPALAEIEITHAWGGNVGITFNRQPMVGEIKPGLWTAGGFSGHGVMLSNHTGTLIAERLLGRSDTINHLRELDIPKFPGGKLLRHPLKIMALSWYALLDRL